METLPALLPELWRVICTVNVIPAEFPYLDPATYSVLVRVARRFALPDAKALFIRVVASDCLDYIETILPNGLRHSVNDMPASSNWRNGRWYDNGKLGRKVLPAIINTDDSQTWIDDGKLRTGLPYQIGSDGEQRFSLDGEPGADSMLPLIAERMLVIGANGSYCWHINGRLHRDVLPAKVGFALEWYQNGRECRQGGLPVFLGPSGEQSWALSDSFGARVKAWHRVRAARIEWFEDWHRRGLFLELTAEDI